MIRNITVDGEEALAVDTAEELGRALLTGRYVVASDAVRAEYGLTDTDNSDIAGHRGRVGLGATTRGARRGGN